jgi:hypothetical protein
MSAPPPTEHTTPDNEPMDIIGCPMSYVCTKRWSELTVTSDANVRHCSQCNKPVTLCSDNRSLDRVRKARGCAAIKSGTGRSFRMILGLPSSDISGLR